MKRPIESLRKKRLKQEQRRKTERFTEEEKKQMKREWNSHSRVVLTNKFLKELKHPSIPAPKRAGSEDGREF